MILVRNSSFKGSSEPREQGKDLSQVKPLLIYHGGNLSKSAKMSRIGVKGRVQEQSHFFGFLGFAV